MPDNSYIFGVCAALVDPYMLNDAELSLLNGALPLSEDQIIKVKEEIIAGRDPLGEAYMKANSSETRRSKGEVYTPDDIISAMITEAKSIREPVRVVDAGCGSGRFTIACAEAFPEAHIIAIDTSPIATLMCKTNLCVLGLQDSVTVLCGNFNTVKLPETKRGATLWIGNPPYVRHHNISAKDKAWLNATSEQLGFKASGLSGLHAYFILSIAQRLQRDDFGVLVTSAEWLDVKYGSLVRELLTDKLGLMSLRLFDRTEQAFKGTDTTALVFAFDACRSNGASDDKLVTITEGSNYSSTTTIGNLRVAPKWGIVIHGKSSETTPKGYVRLGDFARVHRGIVTGANKFWVRAASSDRLSKLTIPVVSHAREIMTGEPELSDDGLSRLIVLPPVIDDLDGEDADAARKIISEGKKLGIDKGYVARNRKCWWSIPTGEGATILMTYMARSAPVFVANPHRIRSLNVVHGIYPVVELSDRAIGSLVDYLNSAISCEEGRTYCGGLTKFEPREVENLWVPSPAMLEEDSWRS